jgi:hypothetical protein
VEPPLARIDFFWWRRGSLGEKSPEETKQTNRYNGNLPYYEIWWEGKTVKKKR